jgi:hypothetical protein
VTEQAAPGLATRSLEIPQWMFDVAACRRVRMQATPNVSARALQELSKRPATAYCGSALNAISPLQ